MQLFLQVGSLNRSKGIPPYISAGNLKGLLRVKHGFVKRRFKDEARKSHK